MSEKRSLEEIITAAGHVCPGIDGTMARVRDLLTEAYAAGQQNPSGLPVVTLVTDCINDGVAIEVDGTQRWWENSFDDIDQFFLHSPELLGRPVILVRRTDDEEAT